MVHQGERRGLPSFLCGMLVGILGTVAVILWATFHLANWLVIDGEIRPADAIVVLGGGDGSRFRKGTELYDAGWADALVLVDTKAVYWHYMLASWCPDCEAGSGPVTILTGSTSTLTDAQLVHTHCMEKGFERILVVTDPYHSRRASIFFNRRFAGSGIDVITVNSGHYRNWQVPAAAWWRDQATLLVVMMETGKIIEFFLSWLLDGDPFGAGR